jgi:hypothetical protein
MPLYQALDATFPFITQEDGFFLSFVTLACAMQLAAGS